MGKLNGFASVRLSKGIERKMKAHQRRFKISKGTLIRDALDLYFQYADQIQEQRSVFVKNCAASEGGQCNRLHRVSLHWLQGVPRTSCIDLLPTRKSVSLA